MTDIHPAFQRTCQPPGGSTTGDLPKVDSAALFATHNIVLIEHDGEIYTLRKTRNGKLILTK
jgi:hemin uptake protein HemP